jgi:hypothetical protein
MARTMTDKIFDNSFEESDYDGRSINWQLDPVFSSGKDTENSINDVMLMEKVDELIRNSNFNKWNIPDKEGKIPKLSKVQISEVYSYISSNVKEYSVIEIFAATSEYFDIQGSKFYNSLSNAHKDELMIELDRRTGIIDRKGIRKLF